MTPATVPDTTPAPGSAKTTPAGSDPIAGTHDLAFTDGYGHSVIDTLDAGDRLLKEVVKDAVSGNVARDADKADGTYDQHSELATTTGSLTVDGVHGPKGEPDALVGDRVRQSDAKAAAESRDPNASRELVDWEADDRAFPDALKAWAKDRGGRDHGAGDLRVSRSTFDGWCDGRGAAQERLVRRAMSLIDDAEPPRN